MTPKSVGRVRETAGKLRALSQACTESGISEERSAALQAAIDDLLSATVDLERRGTRPKIYSWVAVLVCVPLATAAMYYGWGSQHAEHGGAHATVSSGVAPLVDHGSDMQAAIAKLAGKLQQHPEDAEGWALLGRTYKAMQQYERARDAFQHAVEAAPDDTFLAAELAAASPVLQRARRNTSATSADMAPRPQTTGQPP